tara:strand:- start:721 stop:1083 length:363 start_codon:yes stop_codon:yes gene_type:complete
MIKQFLPLLLLTGCLAPYRYAGADLTPSGSPCIDGTLVNMDGAGCEMFYHAQLPDQPILKIRCTYSEPQNQWTKLSFYAVPAGFPVFNDDHHDDKWVLMCSDSFVDMYVAIPIKTENNNE